MNPANPNPIECAAVTSSVRKCEGRGSEERRSPHAGVGGCCDTAHELANLVTAVLMNAHVLQWRMPSHSRMKRPVLEIERQAQRGGELLKYLLQQLESLQSQVGPVCEPGSCAAGEGGAEVHRPDVGVRPVNLPEATMALAGSGSSVPGTELTLPCDRCTSALFPKGDDGSEH